MYLERNSSESSKLRLLRNDPLMSIPMKMQAIGAPGSDAVAIRRSICSQLEESPSRQSAAIACLRNLISGSPPFEHPFGRSGKGTGILELGHRLEGKLEDVAGDDQHAKEVDRRADHLQGRQEKRRQERLSMFLDPDALGLHLADQVVGEQ